MAYAELQEFYRTLAALDRVRRDLDKSTRRPQAIERLSEATAPRSPRRPRRPGRGRLHYHPVVRLALLDGQATPPALPAIPVGIDTVHAVWRITRQIAVFTRWHVRTACFAAAHALEKGDRDALQTFIQDLLGLSPSPKLDDAARQRWSGDHIDALWRVLRAERWTQVAREPRGYLVRAVRKTAHRIALRRAAETCRPEDGADVNQFVTGVDLGSPEAWMDAGERYCRGEGVREHLLDLRPRELLDLAICAEAPPLLRNVLAAVRPGLPPDQAALLELLERGMTPARAVAVIGKNWSPFQALERTVRATVKKAVV